MRKIDATSGPLAKLIIIYTIPLIITTLVQHLFNIVDIAVLGNMADSTAVASVGATGAINNLLLTGFVGLSSGTSVVLARYIGKKDEQGIRNTIDTSILTAIIFGAAIAVLGVILTPTMLSWTDCPEECFDGAVLYLRICISAAPATLLYNYASAVLRAFGDTRRPLIYITVSGAVNVVLNIILCFILAEKVAAVAIATVASKIISAVLVLVRLIKTNDIAHISLQNMRFDLFAFNNIIKFGVPSSISNLIFPIANLQIVSAINSFGVDAVAGNSAAVSIINVASAFSSGFGIATTTFMGQNIGAEKPERVKLSFRYCMMFSIAIAGAIGFLSYMSCELWLRLILGSSATAAIGYGIIRLFYSAQFFFINAINAVMRQSLNAYGYPIFGSLSSIIFTLVFRIIWMQVLYPDNPTFDMIMLCFPVSWALNTIAFIVVIAIISRRYHMGKYKKI